MDGWPRGLDRDTVTVKWSVSPDFVQPADVRVAQRTFVFDHFTTHGGYIKKIRLRALKLPGALPQFN